MRAACALTRQLPPLQQAAVCGCQLVPQSSSSRWDSRCWGEGNPQRKAWLEPRLLVTPQLALRLYPGWAQGQDMGQLLWHFSVAGSVSGRTGWSGTDDCRQLTAILGSSVLGDKQPSCDMIAVFQFAADFYRSALSQYVLRVWFQTATRQRILTYDPSGSLFPLF